MTHVLTQSPTLSNQSKRLKVLLIVEQCNPDWVSVPLVAYRFFDGIRNLVDVTLVTHDRNRTALEARSFTEEIIYISESPFWQHYHDFISRFVFHKRTIWQLYLALTYPIYAEFNQRVFQQLRSRIESGEFDIVHAMTPMMPRYPVKTVQACRNVPFILGPVNGGVPYPKGFQETAKKEFANLNFIRAIGRAIIPGYTATYRQATQILSGSTYTLNLLKELFDLPDEKLSLLYENGVTDEFFAAQPKIAHEGTVKLLFVGRLVPYKCADVAIAALAKLPEQVRQKVHLTIVGDGEEKANLETQVKTLELAEQVTFAGWVSPDQIRTYYQESDVFCFPSIREFGGAVVMEAMAAGLPCIVANNGGIGEYVTEATGFRLEPTSREALTTELASKIEEIVLNPTLRAQMSAAAIDRAKTFTWSAKAQQVVELYRCCATLRASN